MINSVNSPRCAFVGERGSIRSSGRPCTSGRELGGRRIHVVGTSMITACNCIEIERLRWWRDRRHARGFVLEFNSLTHGISWWRKS